MGTNEPKNPLRVISSGVLEGRYNIAIGQALIEGHRDGTTPDTLRFMRFPPTALVGRHQDLSREVNVDYCKDNNIGLVRRITGGGAIYLDEGQLGWELVVNRSSLGTFDLAEVAEKICNAVAKGLSNLGIDVQYRPRNDLEVDGRKISGTGGFFDGNTLFFQGTVLVDMNTEDMEKTLNVPQAKLRKRGISSVSERIVTLKQLLGDKAPSMEELEQVILSGLVEAFDFEPTIGVITESEQALAQECYDEEIGREDFLREIDNPTSLGRVHTGVKQSKGGNITSYLRLEGPNADRIREVIITGDFFITPPRIILDLEAALRGQWVRDIETVTLAFFDETKVDMMSAEPQDFITSLLNAVKNGSDK